MGPDWWIDKESTDKPLLVYKGRHYVPNDQQLRRDILWKHHDAPSAGHPGQQGTYHAVSRYYWWPGLRTFVNNYVLGCTECQKYKIDRRPSKPALQPIDSSRNTRPFAQCSMDLITGLPPVDDYNIKGNRPDDSTSISLPSKDFLLRWPTLTSAPPS